MSDPAPAAVVGVSAVSAFGVGWRGLGQALFDGALSPLPSVQLAASHPDTPSSEVGAIAPADDVADPKARRLMSRSAHLAAIAMRHALEDAGWVSGRDEVGCFLGLGSSGGPMEELASILRASVRDQVVDPALFAKEGLASAHPLLAFHLLGNFTLCHGSIAAGLGGPNRGVYSRGAGTVTAVSEALWSLHEGDCARTLAGGADSALHLATYMELVLEGYVARGLVPGEGAAVLALAKDAAHPLAWIQRCYSHAEVAQGLCFRDEVDALLTAPWGPDARRELDSLRPARSGLRIDLSQSLGDTLAAAPALACAVAVDLFRAGAARSALVVAAGVSEQPTFGAIRLTAP